MARAVCDWRAVWVVRDRRRATGQQWSGVCLECWIESGHIPAVKRPIKTAQAKLLEKGLYDAEEAVKEIDTMIKGALGATSPNYTA
jgi:hypothetical protein